MEEFNKNVAFSFSKDLNKDARTYLNEELKKVEGIISHEIAQESVSVVYDALRLSAVAVKEILDNMGYPVEELKEKRKGILSRFIKNLADSNREIYGKKRLDCCDLNHN